MGSVNSQNSDMEEEVKQSTTPARRNNSDTSVVSNKSTITFEKRKVPPRGRTQSVQSVFSGISLKSILQNNGGGPVESGSHGEVLQQQNGGSGGYNHNGGAGGNPHGPALALVTNFVNASQQIQSPAIASSNMVRRRTTRNSMASTTNIIEEDGELELKIGERLPFTEELLMQAGGTRRRVVEGNSNHSNSSTTTVSSAAPEDSSATPQKLGDTPISGHSSIDHDQSQERKIVGQDRVANVEEEDEFAQQKKLTRDALRKLSILQANKAAVNCANGDNENTLGPNDNLNVSQEPLTHLQFGGKHVILETSRKNSIPIVQTPAYTCNSLRRSSVAAVLCQPEPLKLPNAFNASGDTNTSNEQTQRQEVNSRNDHHPQELNNNNNNFKDHHLHYKKKSIHQINEPKKPMYTPAVLRDISETNITWNQLKVRSPVPSPEAGQVPNTMHFTKTNPSTYASSIHSATSSFLSEYRRKLDVWLGYNNAGVGERGMPHLPHRAVLIPPTRKHWVSDNKRQSCKYCHKLFTFWERRHHCRHCGDIFCQQHVRHWLYLNPEAKFIIGGSGLGMLSKICDGCLEEYERLVRDGPNMSTAGMSDDPSPTENSTSKVDSNKKAISSNGPGQSVDTTVEDGDKASDASGRKLLDNFVGSVPVDWCWSSF